MKPEYANLSVELWLNSTLRTRSFPRPTLCIFHNAISVGSSILDALHELKSKTCAGRLMLTFAQTPRERAISSLRLMRVSSRDDLKVMSIRCESDSAKIEMTDVGLDLLIDAVDQWLEGAEDFGVSPRHSAMKPKEFGALDRDSAELWFWGPYYYAP